MPKSEFKGARLGPIHLSFHRTPTPPPTGINVGIRIEVEDRKKNGVTLPTRTLADARANPTEDWAQPLLAMVGEADA